MCANKANSKLISISFLSQKQTNKFDFGSKIIEIFSQNFAVIYWFYVWTTVLSSSKFENLIKFL